MALGAPVAGRLGDRFGPSRVLRLSILAYGFCGLAGFAATSLAALLVIRAIQGIAVAGALTSATTLLGSHWQGSARQRLLGSQAAAMSLAGVVALLIGGTLAQWHPRGPFLVFLLPWLLIPVLPSHQEDRETHPFALPALKIRQVIWPCLTAGLGMMLFYQIPVQVPFLLKQLDGTGPQGTAIALAVATFISAWSSRRHAFLEARWSLAARFCLLFGLLGAGQWIIAISANRWQVGGGLIVASLGMGLLLPTLHGWILHWAPPGRRGGEIGRLQGALYLGQFLAPPAGQQLWHWGGPGTLFAVSGAALVTLALASFGLRFRTHSSSHSSSHSPSHWESNLERKSGGDQRPSN